MKQKNKITFTLRIFVVILLITIGVISLGNERKEVYMKVNNQYIGIDEIEFVITSIKASVISEIQGAYGLVYDEDFWDTKISNTTPREILEDKVIEKIVRNAVTERVLKEEKILQYNNFKEFNDLLEKVNQERKRAVINKEVIYGPVEYTQLEYYNYLMANNLIQLREHYIETGKIQLTDELLKTYEQENSNLVKSNQDTLETELISMKFVEEDGTVNEEKKKLYLNYMNEVYILLKEGVRIDEIKVLYSDILVHEEHIFSEESKKQDRNTYSNLLDEISLLNEGEMTPVTYDNGAYYICILNEQKEGLKREFETYRNFLAMKYSEKWIEEYIDELIKQAEVEIVESFLK